MGKKITPEELDAYSAPEPKEKSDKLPSFDTQEAAASFVKDMLVMGGQGVSQGFGDEGLAAIKTGSTSSPEYMRERDKIRGGIGKIREEYPVPSAISEAVGSVASTAAVPILRGAPVAKELISAGIQGAGEADEMSDIPSEAGKSMAIQGVMEGAGKAVKNAFFDDPTKILSRSVGVTRSDLKGNPNAKTIRSINLLDRQGFFKQGEVGLSKMSPGSKPKFVRSSKNLAGFFQPQTLDTLTERASKNLGVLRDRNIELLKGKTVPSVELRRGLYEGIQDLTYDPHGWDMEKRYDLARDIEETFLKDLKYKTGWREGKPVPAADIENAKRSLDKYLKGPAFEKKALDMGVDKQAMMKFREKLDDILDVGKVGGDEYRVNNDTMSALLDLQDVMKSKESLDFIDSGSSQIDIRGWKQKLMEGISPTFVDIARSDVSAGLNKPLGKAAANITKRIPTEFFSKAKGDYSNDISPIPSNQEDMESSFETGTQPQGFSQPNNIRPAFQGGRKYNSLGSEEMTPMEIAKTKLPRTTKGLLENKELVLKKLALSGVPDDMIDTVSQALNDDPESVESLGAMVTMQFPTLFAKSKYNMFDGKILDPSQRAKAADDTSKRSDINSIERAKIISELNKTGKYLGE